ncbi:F-box only protein 47-like [Trichomycterus rosablanca]|uniref:F-box only protein 47-like n=1 Tax=Trichomycterus rosablanca TaxID=2290929 RepID=UPI002F35F07D
MKKFTSTCKSNRRCRPYLSRRGSNQTQMKSSQGFIEKLPTEVLDLILNNLTVQEVSVLSMVSKSISTCIVKHVSTLSWTNKMILQKLHCTSLEADDSVVDHFRSLGLLLKRCTLLLPSKDRIKFTYIRFSQVSCFRMDQCVALHHCQAFTYYGVFLQTLIAGWDELECHRVFRFLSETTKLQQKIEAAVTSKPGSCHKLELSVRLFCRGVMFDQWKSRRDALFWLTCLLRPWPIVSQARLLFILFGPMKSDGKLNWQAVQDSVVGQSALLDLAKAIILLHEDGGNRNWTADTILAILNELMVMPQPWNMENVARLLILCGNSICYSVLASKAINGRHFEISRLLIFLILVSEKDGYSMNWAVKMTQQVCQVFSMPSEKWSFIQRMENMFSEVTMELYELVMTGRRDAAMDSTLQCLCTLLNANAHFHTEIVYMLLRKGSDHKNTQQVAQTSERK